MRVGQYPQAYSGCAKLRAIQKEQSLLGEIRTSDSRMPMLDRGNTSLLKGIARKTPEAAQSGRPQAYKYGSPEACHQYQEYR
jgi:hypothetical protein